MLSWLTRFSLKNGAVIAILVLCLIGFGLYSGSTIPMQEYPQVDIPWVKISVAYPGSTPRQAFTDVGSPLEKALNGLQGLKNMYDFSTAGFIELTLEFSSSRPINHVVRDIHSALDSVALPSTAGVPTVTKESPGKSSVYQFALSAPGSLYPIQTYAEQTIQPALLSVSGVSAIDIQGTAKRSVYIDVNPTLARAQGVTLQDIANALQANNFSAPTGTTRINSQSMPIVIRKDFRSLANIRAVPIIIGPIPTLGLKTVKLGAIASVSYHPPASGQVITRLNGQPAVVVGIQATNGANIVTLVDQVKQTLASLAFPAHFRVTSLYNQATETRSSVDSMIREAALGALFAMLVTLVFLRNWRATIVALTAIPLSILAAVTLLSALGYTLNIMTLSGMAVAVGRVVDDSIVVIENLYRRIRAAKEHDEHLIYQGTTEVGSAIASSTATTIAVFLPMAFVPGIVGHFFAPFAWTVIIALAFSLLVAVAVVPSVSKWTLLHTAHRIQKAGLLQRAYTRLLRGALNHKWAVLLVSFVLLLESGYVLGTQLGFNFLPSSQTGSYAVNATMPDNATTATSNAVVTQVEHILAHTAGVAYYNSYVTANSGNVGIALRANAPTDFASALRRRLVAVHGAKTITVSGQNAITGQDQLFLQINSVNYGSMVKASQEIVHAIQSIPGLAGVTSTQQAIKPQVVIAVHSLQAAEKGVTPGMVASELTAMATGEKIGKANFGASQPDILLRINPVGGLHSLDAIRNQAIDTMTGKTVPLGDIATVNIVPGQTEITRLNQQPYIAVTAQITASNSGGVITKVNNAIAKLRLPSGVTWQQQGAAQSMNQGFVNLAMAMIVSLLLVFIIMLVTFSEFAAPLAILGALPFCLVGGANALWITQQPLGMPGMIGFLMLIGIVVTNAIVFMDRVHRKMGEGLTVRDAIIEAGSIRLRPILMTATATIGALLPLAFSTGAGVISNTLAIVVIGGLLTSTLLTLIVVPSAYETLYWMRSRVFRTKRPTPTDNS